MVDLPEPLQLVTWKIRIQVRRRVIEPRKEAELLLGADLIEKIVGIDSVRRRGDDRAAFVIQQRRRDRRLVHLHEIVAAERRFVDLDQMIFARAARVRVFERPYLDAAATLDLNQPARRIDAGDDRRERELQRLERWRAQLVGGSEISDGLPTQRSVYRQRDQGAGLPESSAALPGAEPVRLCDDGRLDLSRMQGPVGWVDGAAEKAACGAGDWARSHISGEAGMKPPEHQLGRPTGLRSGARHPAEPSIALIVPTLDQRKNLAVLISESGEVRRRRAGDEVDRGVDGERRGLDGDPRLDQTFERGDAHCLLSDWRSMIRPSSSAGVIPIGPSSAPSPLRASINAFTFASSPETAKASR